ncbi:MAG: hypothetical protein IPG59_21355 [Candidatus Melainabacteria bacterium]|nr:MAG: hypothetical protein IPG59_21355 [Candidatus Melainabacteria bacterium]
MKKMVLARISLIACVATIWGGAFSFDLQVEAKGKAKGNAKNNQAKSQSTTSQVNYNDPAFKEVKAAYDGGRWKAALDIIATMKPSELTHYYTGLCYQGQNQLAKAASEFQWIATYGKDPRLKYNAQVILNSLSAYSTRRTYQGQGNLFARTSSGYGRAGGTRRG